MSRLLSGASSLQGCASMIAVAPLLHCSAPSRMMSREACSTSGRALEQLHRFSFVTAAPQRHSRRTACSAAEPTPGPLTEDELRALGRSEAELEEQALGDAWRGQFEGDLEGLYDYVARDEEQWLGQVASVLDVPRSMRERQGAMLGLDGLPPGMATDLIGMGNWRLRNSVNRVIGLMVGRLEGAMRELLDDDLTMYPPNKWKDQGWDYIDSLDPQREWDGWSFADMPDPPKGAEGYPRLQVENRVYCSRVFRKLHLEVAVRQDGLEVLHMVLYPRYDFDLPILALDMVVAGGAVTLAVADACPLSANLRLPQHYMQTMVELQEAFLPDPGTSRAVPDWGRAIFSPLAVCMRPDSDQALAGFIKYCVALTRAHLMYSTLLSPIEPRTKPAARRLAELAAGHSRFCANQLANKKTSRVLEAAFGAELTSSYMSQLMFDCDLSDSPPWYDGSLSRLYHEFERNPEPWRDGAELLSIRRELDVSKARVFLDRFIAGEGSIAGERLEFALVTMYDADEQFRDAIDDAMPDLAELRLRDPAEVGRRLQQQLLELVGAGQQQQSGQQQQQQQQQQHQEQ